MSRDLRGLNLGAGPFWRRSGWETTDHKKHWWQRGDTAWRLNFPAESFDLVFSSHMLEHIPHFKIDAVLKECNRVLKTGGMIRLVCPNLETFARAYVARDAETFAKVCDEDPTIRQDLGFGGQLMNFLISPGADSMMFSRNGECIGGYAHVYSYDFEMLKILLERHGFGDVVRSDFGGSAIAQMREPLHVIGTEALWRPEREWPDRRVGTTGFDRSPHSSLFVEARKRADDRSAVLDYGAKNARGLDPVDMGWASMTAGYLSFTWLKLKSVPRALRRRFAVTARQPGSVLNRLARLAPKSLRLSISKWARFT
ncbi:MAG TPA: class I SAM-dependent methyltransferase [Rhizomicrobium sp.]|nr:class I SAM-dependent methyltransferase [Rhizomicrobium sp.]